MVGRVSGRAGFFERQQQLVAPIVVRVAQRQIEDAPLGRAAPGSLAVLVDLHRLSLAADDLGAPIASEIDRSRPEETAALLLGDLDGATGIVRTGEAGALGWQDALQQRDSLGGCHPARARGGPER